MALFKSFEELGCWKEAASLRRELSIIVKGFPQEEKHLLGDQIIRASRSVTSSIAEGFGRMHYPEFVTFYKKSRGSLYELMDHLIVASEEGYISDEQLNVLREKIKKCTVILDGLISYLLRQEENNASKASEPEINYDILSESSNQRIN